MRYSRRTCWPGLAAATLCLTLFGGCNALRPPPAAPTVFYTLDSARAGDPMETTSGAAPPAPVRGATQTLVVNPPHAAAGYDSQRIIYLRTPHKLEYFAHSEWVDPPAHMLAPLLLAAVENSGAFRAVIRGPSAAAGDLRLDTEIIRLQHEFQTQPSRVRFTLRAYIVDEKTRRVLAQREFDAAMPAASEDPYGGVVAANRAVQTVLESLSAFCAETARSVPAAR
jgi:cholesterol transport system auxiliary component